LKLTRRDVLTATLAAIATGSLRTPVVRAGELSSVDDLLTKFVSDHEVPGAAAAIARGGKLVYARGFGHADAEKSVATPPDAMFRIASVSKPITAVGILQLVDAGKIQLDKPATSYLTLEPVLEGDAKFDERWKKVTVRQCLQHTGGWDRNAKGSFDPIAVPGRIAKAMELKQAPGPVEIVRFMMGRPLDFDPGARYAYSNLGFLVLGRIIEAVTGQSYEPWIRKNVLAPVGAARMALGRGLPEFRAKGEVAYHDSRKRSGACLYPPKTGQQVPRPDGADNIEAYEAHGGWVASAIDLVRFASSFADAKKSPLLSASAIKEMWSRPEGAAGLDAKGQPKPSYYGLGWSVRPDGDSNTVTASHDGLIPGTSSLLARRADGIAVAVLFNTDANAKGTVLSGLIGRPLHDAIATIAKWPGTDLYEKFRAGK
jgi:N-acyl-D-amino-acid deacylase